jgi:hypothetical protein
LKKKKAESGETPVTKKKEDSKKESKNKTKDKKEEK